MTTVLVTIVLFGVIMAMMAVGVIFSGRCLRGSCGGPDVIGPDGEPIRCATCPKRKEDALRAQEHGAGDESCRVRPVATVPRYGDDEE
jgi:hypothetical protein